MAIFLNGPGGLFNRLGFEFGGMRDMNAIRGGSATYGVSTSAAMNARVLGTIDTAYNASTPLPQVIDGIATALVGFNSGLDALPADFQTRAQNTLKAMYGIDVLGLSPRSPLATFQSVSLVDAVKTLIAQMTSSSQSVQQATVSAGAQTAVGTPNGNPVIVLSLVNGLGSTLQLPFPETLTFKCTQDSQNGATAGNESVSVIGQPAVSSPLSFQYPGGSGLSATLNAIDGSKNNSTGNLLTNSDFLTATTSNYPDNWLIGTGSAGTNVFQGTGSDAYTTSGGYLKFTGDGGGTLAAVTQEFNHTASTAAGLGGTPGKVVQNRVYHVNGWVKVSAVPAAGVVEVALTNSSGTILTNDAGTQQKFTIDLTARTTSYAAFNGAFQLPNVLPSAVRLRIRLSTAIDSGKSLFLGRVSCAQANSGSNGNGIYPGGPFVTIHSGNTILINGQIPDQWTVAIANNYTTVGSGLMQSWMDRVFGLRTLATPALQLPYSGSATILDSLIG